jgi:hypothetical protein
MSKKLDSNSVDWSSFNDDSCLSTRFNQDLLRAKLEINTALKDDFIKKIKAK